MTVSRKPDAVFDDYQESVLSMINDMYPNINLKATSGHRTASDQLSTIASYALSFAYPEFNKYDVIGKCVVDIEGKTEEHYTWYRTWGECLRKGIIVNPPIASIVPYNYISNGINKKGQVIPASNHIKPLNIDPSKETCPIDWSAKIDDKPDIERVNECMEQAKASGVPIKSIVVEHGNGCVHINLSLRLGK